MSSSTKIGTSPRGDDFTNKYRKGEWAEEVLCRNLSKTDKFLAIQYGISRSDSLSTEDELAGVKEPNSEQIKRPDILLFSLKDSNNILSKDDVTLLNEFNTADPNEQQELLDEIEDKNIPEQATAAIEAEASRFNKSIRSTKYNSLSVYIKMEDQPRLDNWTENHPTVDLYICQLFYDCGYIIPYEPLQQDINSNKKILRDGCPGLSKKPIPNLRQKIAFDIALDKYPFAFRFGFFKKSPLVASGSPDNRKLITYDWDDKGKLQTPESSPYFHGGKLKESAIETLEQLILNISINY